MRVGKDARQIKFRFRISNSRGVQQHLIVEPWGDQHFLEAHTGIDIVARGPDKGERELTVELELTDVGITLYGWFGSLLEVVQEGGG